MITSANIMIFIFLVCSTIMLFVGENKKKKRIGIILIVLLFTPAMFFNLLWNSKYYFSYQKFYNEFNIIKQYNVENFMLEPQYLETKNFRCYHKEIWFGEKQEMSVSFIFDSADYENIIAQLTVDIQDMNLSKDEEVIGLQNESFEIYGKEIFEKVARDNLVNENYYFLKYCHKSNLVYGIILNDKTKEVIQFYYYS